MALINSRLPALQRRDNAAKPDRVRALDENNIIRRDQTSNLGFGGSRIGNMQHL
jgi:hypothetical protein